MEDGGGESGRVCGEFSSLSREGIVEGGGYGADHRFDFA